MFLLVLLRLSYHNVVKNSLVFINALIICLGCLIGEQELLLLRNVCAKAPRYLAIVWCYLVLLLTTMHKRLFGQLIIFVN